MCAFVCALAYVGTCSYAHGSVCGVNVYTYVCVLVCPCVCAGLCICVCTHMGICRRALARAGMCVCVCVCTHLLRDFFEGRVRCDAQLQARLSDKGITNVAQNNLWLCCFHSNLNDFTLMFMKKVCLRYRSALLTAHSGIGMFGRHEAEF